MRQMYPLIEPFASGYVEVGGPHRLYYEQSGNPEGIPVVCLHGGPGSGCAPWHRCFFDPDRFHIILYDQRGAGKSQPQGCLESNTTESLLADLEVLRRRLGVERWIVFGGSWGATLALLYAQTCPGQVTALVLRGVFLARPRDRAWFFGSEGVARLFPEAYAAFLAGLGAEERSDPVMAYQLHLSADDPVVRQTAALAWHAWEHAITSYTLKSDDKASEPDPAILVVRAAIACHYARNGYFLGDDGALVDVEQLSRVPGVIVHGRRDLVCPLENAVTLHQAWPDSALVVLDHSGHPAVEPEIQDALIGAMETLAERAVP
ncbi:MAG: prolyl aminopeptidase [Gammaproteobacteria bacterium]|nr:MAG: prolyl aminopeptidase [Gammaproteobacteria bacterium]